MASATYTLRSKKNAKGVTKWYVLLNLEGKRTDRFGGYNEKEAHKKGIALVAEYNADPSSFFSKGRGLGSGLEGIIEEFLDRPVSDKTNNLNRGQLEALIERYQFQHIGELDKYALKRIKKDMKDAGLSDSYIAIRLKIVRTLLRFCLDKGYIKKDPWPTKTEEPISLIPRYRSKGYYYTDDELEKLTTLPAQFSEAQLALNRAIRLALFQGWREEHVWAFDWQYIDMEKGTYHLYGMKGAQDRDVPLHPETIKIIAGLGEAKASGRIFTCWSHPEAISLAFRRFRRSLGIKRGRFHDLKHTCVSKLEEKGYTLAEQEAITNTSRAALIHYAHSSKKRLEQKFPDFNPLQKQQPPVRDIQAA